ncbi:EamA family transporter RarD [Salinispirillum marinum]|uniref:EamA family transporter RarD n=2 Tax=Saccharospirillaceae TaxID=255527 RepID=A0ABV8BD89_9GAMM
MDKTVKSGVIYALTAYGLWAVAPMYFKVMQNVAAPEILAHRVLWSFLLTLGLIILMRKRAVLWATVKSPRARWLLLCSTTIIGFNWGLFIWAVQSGFMLSTSLGYYINPLVNILFGMLFFGERLGKVKTAAALICLAAVAYEVIQFGRLPWIALALGVSFALYGLVRKKLAVDSFTGMAMETGLLLPLAIGYLWFTTSPTSDVLNNSGWTNFLLFAAGPVTMVPLMCFAAAANRISMTALGFFQYIAPSGVFLLAVFVYGEELVPEKLVTFGMIWFALIMLSVDTLYRWRRGPRIPVVPAA